MNKANFNNNQFYRDPVLNIQKKKLTFGVNIA